MKRLLMACLPALLLALPSQAHAFFNVDFGAKVWARVNWNGCQYGFGDGGGVGPQAGPWYSYWPYEAHFISPAPYAFPYGAPPMTPPPAQGIPAPAGRPYVAPAPTPVPVQPTSFQRVGYYPQAPSYWYER